MKDDVGTCERCGTPYWKNSNRAKYCPPCKAIVQKQQVSDGKIAYDQRRGLKTWCYGLNSSKIASDMAKDKK